MSVFFSKYFSFENILISIYFIGSIIANEKRYSLGNATTSLTSNSNIFKFNKSAYKPQPSDKNTSLIDDELSKKLENRRQSILASQQQQQLKQQQKMQQKLLMHQKQQLNEEKLVETTVNLQIDVKSSSSLSSESASNSTRSSASSSSSPSSTSSSLNAHNYLTKSPLPALLSQSPLPHPVLKPVDNNQINVHSHSSSSSSSLSTCSNESGKAKAFTKSPNNGIHSLLLNELKSVVPLIDTENTPIGRSTVKKSASLITLASNMSTAEVTFDENNNKNSIQSLSEVKTGSTGPVVAPKNFTPDALKSITIKNQVVNMRENLLDSIKCFSANSLKKVANDSNLIESSKF